MADSLKLIIFAFWFLASVFAMTDQEVHMKFNQLFSEIQNLKKQVSHASEFCKTLSKDVCGACTCLDDFRQEKGYYCDCQQLRPKRDCLEFFVSGYKISGLYKITMNSWYQGKITPVYCDQDTDGGGWTVFQRRRDGSVNFYRNWKEFKRGFGDVRNEFWLGNEKLHDLISQAHFKGNELRVDLRRYFGYTRYAKYSSFSVGTDQSKYKLQVSGYTGNTGDYLVYNNNMMFSTYDQDNDGYSSYNQASRYVGAWWHTSSLYTSLNGFSLKNGYGSSYRGNGIYWGGYIYHWTEMKVRRKI